VVVAVIVLSRPKPEPPATPPFPEPAPKLWLGPSPTPSPTRGFATIVLSFGSKGVGPGMFSDARSVAVDAKGVIYVADYTGGRLQVFDPEGKFITQWLVDTKMPLEAMAADRNGVVYVVQGGDISRYEGATGKPLGRKGGAFYEDVLAMP